MHGIILRFTCLQLLLLFVAHNTRADPDCKVSAWSTWTTCDQTCGDSGISRRSRQKIAGDQDDCDHFTMQEFKPCNRFDCNPQSTSPPTTMITTKPANKDPCKDYTLDTDTTSWQRSTGYIIPINSKTEKCDRPFRSGWYRFNSGAGNKMPTTCPPERACGTRNPIWLNGEHPDTVGEQKTLRACVQISKDSCCANSWNLDVKKCSADGKEFFVYNLQEVPGCAMSYCVGKETKCPQGESSATGFTPCSSKFPKLNGDPQISVDVHNKRMRFKCKFDPKDKGAEVRHEVIWYGGPPEAELDRKVLARGDYNGDTTEAYLQNTNRYGEKPTFCLNQNIYCEVRSYYVGKEQFGFKRKSNEYYAGLIIDPKEVVLGENAKPVNVNIKSTVPIVCQDGTENCHVQLEVGQSGAKDSFVDYCTLKFKPGPKGRSLDLQVVAKRDFVDDGDQQMKIKLFVPDHVDPVDWNCYKNISDINVKTRDVTTARCKSTGDPHLTTFDGYYYNHFQVGDYVFVKSEARKFEVHVRTFRCHTVSCNCGVAAREGDDVLVVDMCRDNVPRARYASTVQPQKETTIERSQNGKVFVLNFPSGAYVRFEAKKWFGRWHYANIVIQVPSDDFEKTKGLCGTWDRIKNNDLTAKDGNIYGLKSRRIGDPRFTESWK
uniref:VWFD domain-containing protein n=1 Tax=Clytia hemisphaerica TaxID=252671 RepID=A0A7M5WQE5_9CNID